MTISNNSGLYQPYKPYTPPPGRYSFGHTEHPLTARMKMATSEIHSKVEQSEFMLKLRNGTVSRAAYFQYISDLTHIYHALEERIVNNQEDVRILPLMIPEMFRTQNLKSDADYLGGEVGEPSPNAKQYIEHLNTIDLHLLIAHAYTRYLGDLFGGQMLQPAVVNLFGADAAKFYDFSQVVQLYNKRSPQAFAMEYKQTLDAIPLDVFEKNQVIEEASKAFKFAGNCLEELKGL